jgi:hypothetical protein
MLFGRRKEPEPVKEIDAGESKVEEIAAQKVKSDATLARANRVLSQRDEGAASAFSGAARAAGRYRRRVSG